MEKKQKKKLENAKSRIDEAEKLRRRLQSLFDKKRSNSSLNKTSEKSSIPNKGPVNNTANKLKAKQYETQFSRENEIGQQQVKSEKHNTQTNQNLRVPLKPSAEEQQRKVKNKNQKLKGPINSRDEEQQQKVSGKKNKNYAKVTTGSAQFNGFSKKHGMSQPKKTQTPDENVKVSTQQRGNKESPKATTKPIRNQKSDTKQVNSKKRKAPMKEAHTHKIKKTKLRPFQEMHNLETSEDETLQHSQSSAVSVDDNDPSPASQGLTSFPGFVGYSPHDELSDDDSDRYFNWYDNDETQSDDSFENSFEEEEEEENYSDYDEDDYEEEEDSYDYSSASNEVDFESTGSEDFDYQLPDDVPEDLIIHKGTAAKRNLEINDNVNFDSENEEAQVIELEEHISVKIVKQPEAYDRAELIKLTERTQESTVTLVNSESVNKLHDDELTSNDTECPQLVPIVDKDGFQLYSKEIDQESIDTLGSEYEEVSDSDDLSFNEENVNVKYLPDQMWGEDADFSDDGSSIDAPSEMKADVIIAENVLNISNLSDNKENEGSNNFADVLLSDQLSVDRATFKGTVLTTAISDKLKENAVKKSPKGLKENTKPSFASEKSEPVSKIKEHQSDEKNDSSESSNCTLSAVTESRSVFCNAIDSNHVLVQLRDTLYIYGTVKLILIAGSIEIYGYTPKLGEELEIFSPRGLPAVAVNPKSQMNTKRESIEMEIKRLQSYFAKTELKKLSETYDLEKDALFILKRNEQRKQLTNIFKKYMSENLFPNMNSIQTERPHYASEFLLRCIINTQSDKALRIPIEWTRLKLKAESRLMLIGGKAVGKSTLLRYLVNRNLAEYSSILVIDLDIGQPELFVPQTISATLLTQPLIGPGFMLNLQPAKAFAIGHSNIVLCPHLYMKAVKKLLNWCREQPQYGHVPWLINTMGYNKGFGAELIAVVCELLQPTDVVQLQSNKDINNFDYLLDPHVMAALPRNVYSGAEFRIPAAERLGSYAYYLHVINSAVLQESRYQREWDMSAKDMRYAIILARLSDVQVGNSNIEWLTDCKPLCTSLNDLKFVNLLAGEYTRGQILKAVEANLVYLCNQKVDSDILQCFGIGVVRGIDYHVNQIYLLPAAPHQIMSNVNCLAIGEMPLPTSMFTNQGPKVKNIAPFVYNTVAANASKSIKQIYHRPDAFLRGNHKT